MGMRFVLIRATPKQIAQFPIGRDHPWMLPAGSLLSIFGGRGGKISPWEALEKTDAPRLDIDKAWHGLHFLLTGLKSGGSLPAAFIGSGGKRVQGTLSDFGQARMLDPDEAREVGSYLESLSRETLYDAFDPARMEELDIYPPIWDEGDEAFDYLWEFFEEMRAFVAGAAADGDGFLCRIE